MVRGVKQLWMLQRQSTCRSKLLWECIFSLKLLASRSKVTLYWVSDHCDIVMNEIAANLAIQGATSSFVGLEPFYGVPECNLGMKLGNVQLECHGHFQASERIYKGNIRTWCSTTITNGSSGQMALETRQNKLWVKWIKIEDWRNFKYISSDSTMRNLRSSLKHCSAQGFWWYSGEMPLSIPWKTFLGDFVEMPKEVSLKNHWKNSLCLFSRNLRKKILKNKSNKRVIVSEGFSGTSRIRQQDSLQAE